MQMFAKCAAIVEYHKKEYSQDNWDLSSEVILFVCQHLLVTVCKLLIQGSTIQQRKVINNAIRNISKTNHSMLIMCHLVTNPGIVELASTVKERGNSTASLQ